ncbi:MAG: hypothetical protein Kow00129_03810 [Thermoleophilia bacterium]
MSIGHRLKELRYLGWDLGIRAMERAAGHRRGESLDFRLALSARDLVNDKSRALKSELDALRGEAQALRVEAEALAQSLARAGSSVGPEDALRTVRRLRAALREQLPPDLAQKLADCLPEPDARRFRESR